MWSELRCHGDALWIVSLVRCLISDGCVIDCSAPELLPPGQTRPAQLTPNALLSHLLSVWLFWEGKPPHYSYFFCIINYVYCTYFGRQVDSNIIPPKIVLEKFYDSIAFIICRFKMHFDKLLMYSIFHVIQKKV